MTALVEDTGASGVHPREEGEHCAAGLCQTRSLKQVILNYVVRYNKHPTLERIQDGGKMKQE